MFHTSDRWPMTEPEVSAWIRTLPAGDVFYDLGACGGFFSKEAHDCGLQVVAFEPEPKNYELLSRRMEGTRAKCLNYAITDGRDKFVQFRVGQDRPGGHHKTVVTNTFCGMEGIASDAYKQITVSAASLDGIIEEMKLRFPQHIKVDVDGSELDLLRGASKTLKGLKTLMIELNVKSPYHTECKSLIEASGLVQSSRWEIPKCPLLFNCLYTRQDTSN